MRILVVDHNAIDPVAARLYALISQYPAATLRVLIPRAWHDNYRMREGTAGRLSERCEVIPVAAAFPSRTHRMLYGSVWRHIRMFQPDILYVNAEPENFQTFQCAVLARRSPRLRLVFSTWRNIEFRNSTYPYRAAFLHARIERFVLRHAAHAIAFNNDGAALLARAGFLRSSVIPPEVDTALFRPLRTADWEQGRAPFVVGYAGRFHEQKGVGLLIGALAILPPDCRLLLVGSGAHEAVLRAEARANGVADRIAWHPPVQRSAMPAQFADMDLLVLPSRTQRLWKEQFGRVLTEAMACGVPVIGSRSGAIPSVIGDAGIVVDEGRASAIAAAILQVKETPGLRQDLIARGLRRVHDQFALPTVSRAYVELFERLMRE